MTPVATVEALRDQGGGLLEIYALDVGDGGWDLVLAALAAAGYEVTVGDGPPADPEQDGGTPVRVAVGRTRWWTFAADPGVVDFQGEPADIRSPEDVDAVLAFMAVLARTTGREVRLVPETLDPAGTAAYLVVPPAG